LEGALRVKNSNLEGSLDSQATISQVEYEENKDKAEVGVAAYEGGYKRVGRRSDQNLLISTRRRRGVEDPSHKPGQRGLHCLALRKIRNVYCL
jgi:hypothetical protein